MRQVVAAAGLALGVVLAAAPAAAQGFTPFAVEVRTGFAFPTGDFAEGETVESGVGFGAAAMFQVMPMIGVYAGWDRYVFGVEDDPAFPNAEAEVIDSGFSVGAQLSVPTLMMGGLSPWVRGGAVYRTAEIDVNDGSGGEFNVESDKSLGFEVGGGLGIPLGQVLTFTPGVRYRSYAPEYEGTSDENVSYVSVDLGLKFGF